MRAWVVGSVVVAVLLADPSEVRADDIERKGFWGGVDVGAGRVERTGAGVEGSGTDVYLGFKAGYALTDWGLVGVELSGWNQEATDRTDDTKGEGLMQIFVISRLYPMRDSNFFAKIGTGWARQWINGPRGTSTRDGWGATLGVGYDIPLGGGWSVTPFFNYGFGDLDSQDYRAYTLGAGFTFY